jgi:hypothetical protein
MKIEYEPGFQGRLNLKLDWISTKIVELPNNNEDWIWTWISRKIESKAWLNLNEYWIWNYKI